MGKAAPTARLPSKCLKNIFFKIFTKYAAFYSSLHGEEYIHVRDENVPHCKFCVGSIDVCVKCLQEGGVLII